MKSYKVTADADRRADLVCAAIWCIAVGIALFQPTAPFVLLTGACIAAGIFLISRIGEEGLKVRNDLVIFQRHWKTQAVFRFSDIEYVDVDIQNIKRNKADLVIRYKTGIVKIKYRGLSNLIRFLNDCLEVNPEDAKARIVMKAEIENISAVNAVKHGIIMAVLFDLITPRFAFSADLGNGDYISISAVFSAIYLLIYSFDQASNFDSAKHALNSR